MKAAGPGCSGFATRAPPRGQRSPVESRSRSARCEPRCRHRPRPGPSQSPRLVADRKLRPGRRLQGLGVLATRAEFLVFISDDRVDAVLEPQLRPDAPPSQIKIVSRKIFENCRGSVTTPPPEAGGFLEHTWPRAPTLRSTGPVRASQPVRAGGLPRDASQRTSANLGEKSGIGGPATSGSSRLVTAEHFRAKLVFPGIRPLYRGPSSVSRCVEFSQHAGAAIPSSPEGDGPLAAF